MAGQANIGDLVSKVYALLTDVEPEERSRVVQAALMAFGQSYSPPPPAPLGGARAPGSQATGTSKEFFAEKKPRNKGEELAVAARFIEQNEGQDKCTREEIKQTISSARRDFDDRNFGRDIRNATTQAGFFNKGTARGHYKLSYHGQQYVDALPDRDAAKTFRKPVKRTKAPKKRAKKTAKKK